MNALTPTLLHIGAPKCGSSALQTSLTNQPLLKSITGSDSFYAAIREDGSVISGHSLVENVQTNPWGYISSVRAKLLAGLPKGIVNKIKLELSALSKENGRLILSNEGWLNECDTIQRTNLLKNLGLDCTVIIYIRNPVEWINSAWWQWGAWTDLPFATWFKNVQSRVNWYDSILPWFTLEGVNKVIVKIVPDDIVSDFCRTFMLLPIKSLRSNSKLPSTILRLYQRNRFLRSSSHGSVIDFILSKHFSEHESDPAPWVVGPYTIRRILADTKEGNTKLLGVLEETSTEVLKNDLRWWSPEAFENKSTEPLILSKLPAEKLEAIAAKALQALFQSERELLKCKKRLRKVDNS